MAGKTLEYWLADVFGAWQAGANPEQLVPKGWTLQEILLAASASLDDCGRLKHKIEKLKTLLELYRNNQSEEVREILLQELEGACQDERFEPQSFDEIDAERE